MLATLEPLFQLAALFAASVALQTTPVQDQSPMWSPDGERIVFASTRSGDLEIYVMNADGSDVARLTHRDGYDGDPSWSPDGSKIAFCTDRDRNPEIYVMDPDGKNPANLTRHPASDCDMPSWSPDGQHLTFVSNRDGDWRRKQNDNFEIYVMNADGSGQRRLTKNRGWDLSTGQAWTPDGEHIVFCSSGDAPFSDEPRASGDSIFADFDLYRIDVDGSEQTRLTFTHEEDSYPYVGPSGDILYSRYLRHSGTGYDLYLQSANGRTTIRMTDGPGMEGTAAWSPDGARIVFAASDGTGAQTIWVANADGSSAVRITGDRR